MGKDNRMELISVIVAVYNAERYLHRCIESIKGQTYTNLEIILIDDGSVDNSYNICQEFANRDLRIKCVHKENGGAASARNLGLDISKGDYIFFVDCDDYIDRDTLKIMYNYLEENHADMSICDYVYVDEEGKPLKEQNAESWKDETISGKLYLAKNCMKSNKVAVVVWNKLYARQIFTNLRYIEGKLHEDELLFHKVCAACEKVVVVGKKLYFYTQRTDSIMGNYDYLKGIDALEAYLRRILYMNKQKEIEVRGACEKMITLFYTAAFLYSRALGFENIELNKQIRELSREVLQFIPILLKSHSLKWKQKIEFCVWMLSPRFYGKIWRNNKSEEQ